MNECAQLAVQSRSIDPYLTSRQQIVLFNALMLCQAMLCYILWCCSGIAFMLGAALQPCTMQAQCKCSLTLCCTDFATCGGANVTRCNTAQTPHLWQCVGFRGWAVAVTQVLLYAAPLSTLYKAVKARSSASFHLGLGILGFLSSAMWTIYGGVCLLACCTADQLKQRLAVCLSVTLFMQDWISNVNFC